MMTHREFSKRGGHARARKLTRKRRQEIARRGARKRWAQRKTAAKL